MRHENVPVEHVGVRRLSTRDRVLTRLRAFFDQAALGGRVVGALVAAADELVLRAFASAAVTGKDAELPFGHEVRVTVGMDSQHVALAVFDRCGRRYRSDLAGAIASAFSRRRFDDVEQDIAVAVAARASTHIVVNVGTTGATEFLCFVERAAGRRSRSLAEAPRSFGLFSEDSGEAANGW